MYISLFDFTTEEMRQVTDLCICTHECIFTLHEFHSFISRMSPVSRRMCSPFVLQVSRRLPRTASLCIVAGSKTLPYFIVVCLGCREVAGSNLHLI